MRKFCFAIILVGAAFAGGAAVNGPGLDRLKAFIRARFQPPRAVAQTPAVPKQVPAAPLVPLAIERGHDAGTAPIAVDKPSRTIAVAPPPPRSELASIDQPSVSFKPAEPEPMPDPAVGTASRRDAPVQDWAELRRRMQELGVSRYEIEGAPNGRSRFRCLIPLAGRRAVGQQFEGEGDDDFQAASAALRRVSLWRATELAPP